MKKAGGLAKWGDGGERGAAVSGLWDKWNLGFLAWAKDGRCKLLAALGLGNPEKAEKTKKA